MSSAVNLRRRSHRSEAAHYHAMLSMPQTISPYASRFGFFPIFRRERPRLKT